VIIQTTKGFAKQYAKLAAKVQQRFKNRMEVFVVDPFNPTLRNHPLKGKHLGYRSIDITGDVRALYTVKGDMVIIFGFVGTHSQLYDH
jgi:addiction module RelE/StbE family toxin